MRISSFVFLPKSSFGEHKLCKVITNDRSSMLDAMCWVFCDAMIFWNNFARWLQTIVAACSIRCVGFSGMLLSFVTSLCSPNEDFWKGLQNMKSIHYFIGTLTIDNGPGAMALKSSIRSRNVLLILTCNLFNCTSQLSQVSPVKQSIAKELLLASRTCAKVTSKPCARSAVNVAVKVCREWQPPPMM